MNLGARLFITGFITVALYIVVTHFLDDGATEVNAWDYVGFAVLGLGVLLAFVGAYWFVWTVAP